MNVPSSDSSDARGVTTQIPIRWGDMDALGHVNNVIYLRYCESARIAYFETLQGGYTSPDGTQGILLVQVNLNFRKPLVYPGTVSVTVRTTAVGRSSITQSYVLRNAADGTVACDGSSVVVWTDYKAGKSVPLPPPLVEALAALEGNPDLRRRPDR